MTRRMCIALLLALVGLGIPPAHAGVSPFWQQLGNSATGRGVSLAAPPREVYDVSVAVDTDGRPIVAYAQFADGTAFQGAIVVKRWNGSAWQTLSAAVGQGYLPQVRLSPTGEIFVAWLQDDGTGNSDIRLRKYNGSSFVPIGGSDSPGGITGTNPWITFPFSLAIDPDGHPVVAFLARAVNGVFEPTGTPAIIDFTQQVYVRRWNGAAWVFVGSDFSGGGASHAVSFKAAFGPSIVDVVHSAETPSLTIDSTGAPVVAFAYVTELGGSFLENTDIYVKRWNGTAWTAVGPGVPAGDGAAGQGAAGGVSNSDNPSLDPSIAALPAGGLALAWEEVAADGSASVTWVRVWNGTSWIQLAGSATGNGFNKPATYNEAPQIAVDPEGRPVVAWMFTPAVEDPTPQIFVKRWNGTDAWQEPTPGSANNDGVSGATLMAFGPALALAPPGAATAGAPTVAWMDVKADASPQVWLRQLYVGPTFPLTIDFAGSGTGTVTSGPIGLACNGDCTTELPPGTVVTLTATPVGDKVFFAGWSGDGCTGTNPSCVVTMSQARTVTASFGGGNVTLSVTVSGDGRVTSSVGGLNCRTACGLTVLGGTTVTLTAISDLGRVFAGWGGACESRGTATTCPLTLGGNTSVTASFVPRKHTVSVTTVGAGHVTGPGPIDCATGDDGHRACTAEYDYGTKVTLAALPGRDSQLTSWSGCTKALTGTTCTTAALTTNVSVKATFGAARTLSVSASGNGNGKITASTSPQLVCTNNCSVSALVSANASVMLTPTPAVGTTFRWLTPPGDVCTGTLSCSVKMNANHSAVGVFTLNRHTLSVTSRTSGNVVTVDALPDTIDCGAGGVGKCSATLDYGTVVRLQTVPLPGSAFVSWTGGCTPMTSATCSVSMTANRTVTPTYRDVTRVSLTKTGIGSVTSTPAGLSCGATCTSAQFDFLRGTLVKLTPTTPIGWNFVGWTGDCSGTGICSLNTSGKIAFMVAAAFAVQSRRLSVTVLGGGTVTGPDGFACDSGSTPCGQDFAYGTVAKLTPVAAPGFRFTGWSQGCTGTSPTTCQPSMTADRAVTATFKPVFGVTVTHQGNVTPGTITAPGISCGADCQEDYLAGTVVTFSRAAPGLGRTFRWLGDCAFRGANASCTLTIDASKSVIAEYSSP